MDNKYTVGIDFGTLSGRALLVDVADGREVASVVMDYPHAVIDEVLPASGEVLPVNWALEDPRDYLLVLEYLIPALCKEAAIKAEQIVGIGIDFTCCTVLPIKADGTPLCALPEFEKNKHAYVKLWKHHASQPYADRMNEVAAERGEDFPKYFGGKISSEWLFPKLLQTHKEAPEVTAAADYYIEAGDWLNLLLTGNQRRSYLFASYKAEYLPDRGYPSDEYLAAVDPDLPGLAHRLLDAPVVPLGECVGRVTAEAAARFGLAEGTAVATAIPDAHVAAPAVGLVAPGEIYGIFGTSNCYFTLSELYRDVPGICGVVPDGLMPGFYGLEAGLCCVGDHFAWVTENLATSEDRAEADALGIPLIQLLVRRAAAKRPGQTGLLALDWWNGNRNILVDGDLCGMLVGMTLRTKTEDILRALIEATAFATKVIIDRMDECGVKITSLVAAGGIARKDAFTMQVYADILGIPIKVVASKQAPALGSAIWGAVAAGEYESVFAASEAMKSPIFKSYEPNPENAEVYSELYAEYLKLHDYFGRGENDVMKKLLRLANMKG
ncbi:MAG: ribulokinase [Eubacteriales bacterium]